MGSLAEVGECTLGICGNRTVLEVLVDVLTFICLSCCTEFLHGVGLGYFMAHNRLLLSCQFLHLGLDGGEVGFLNHLSVLEEHVVEESVLYGRTESKLNTGVKFLKCLGKKVG